jgi:hypothetical protein
MLNKCSNYCKFRVTSADYGGHTVQRTEDLQRSCMRSGQRHVHRGKVGFSIDRITHFPKRFTASGTIPFNSLAGATHQLRPYTPDDGQNATIPHAAN